MHNYGTDFLSLKLPQDYLLNRRKTAKVDFRFSTRKKIIFGVLQSSILGLILFNLFMCEIFLFLHEAQSSGYADDNTPFVVRHNISDVIAALKEIGTKLLIWFSDNQMKLNADKCHLLMNKKDQNFLQYKKFLFRKITGYYF